MKQLPEPPLEPPPSYWDEPEEDSAPESWLDRFLRKEKKDESNRAKHKDTQRT